MPLASHHVAFTEYRGKMYAFGGFVLPQSGPPAVGAHRQRLGIRSRRGQLEGARSRADEARLARGGDGGRPDLRYRRRSARPAGRAIPLPGLHWSLRTLKHNDPATNTSSRSVDAHPSDHAAAGLVNGQGSVIGGRVGAAGITAASNTSVVEEYDPGTDSWGGVRARMPTARSAMASGVYGGRTMSRAASFRTAR